MSSSPKYYRQDAPPRCEPESFRSRTVAIRFSRERRTPNDYFGIAIGFTFIAGFTAVGSIHIGVFNPAAGLGLFLAKAIAGHSHALALGDTLYYTIAPCIASVLADKVYEYQSKSAPSRSGKVVRISKEAMLTA